jgi:hypothetical protein
MDDSTNREGGIMVSCNALTLDLGVFGFSILLGFLFILIRYLVAITTNDERGIVEAKYLTGELILSIIIVLIIAAILNHATTARGDNNVFIWLIKQAAKASSPSLTPFSLDNDKALHCNGLEYLKKMVNSTMVLYKVNLWVAMVMGQLSTFGYTISPVFAFIQFISIQLSGLQPLSYVGSEWRNEFFERANLLLNGSIMPLIAQFYILFFFSNTELLKLFPLIIVFRTIPVFKGLGNVLFSFIVSFIIVLPLILSAENYVFKLDVDTSSFTGYNDKLNNFGLLLGKPIKEATTLSLGVMGDSWSWSSNVEYHPATHYLITKFFNLDVDNKKFKLDDKVVVNYEALMRKNAEAFVKAAFLSVINLIALVVSIRSLQILFGDTTENLFEMFMRWV